MRISGRKTRSIFDRYKIVNEADLREAGERIQSYLEEAERQKNRTGRSNEASSLEKAGQFTDREQEIVKAAVSGLY